MNENPTLNDVLRCRQVLAGMIVSPLCWKNNEWVGLTVGCSMSEILDSLRDVTDRHDFRFEKYFIGKIMIFNYNK